jgi:leucine dehydrogenase
MMHHPDLSPGMPPEAVHVMRDPASGLEGVIVLHSTRLGPAAGGCRLWHYADGAAATTDALRLAEGMAYKNAMADLPLGGGKAVIRRPAGNFDRVAMFRAFGREVERLDGSYLTAEDVGTGVEDMRRVREETTHVAGLPVAAGAVGGDPSPWTALGVLRAMEEAVRRRHGSGLSGARVAVQGLGHVGEHLAMLLKAAGARLVVTDIDPHRAAESAARLGAQLVAPDAILDVPCDVFAPCALGGVLDEGGVRRLKAGIVCGAANNVLASDSAGLHLMTRGVLYCPDYVVNSGGIINVCAEHLGWSMAEVKHRVNATGQRLGAVLDHAASHHLAPHRAADSLARARIAERRMDSAQAA